MRVEPNSRGDAFNVIEIRGPVTRLLVAGLKTKEAAHAWIKENEKVIRKK